METALAQFRQVLLDPQPHQLLAALLAWLGVAAVMGGLASGIVFLLHRAGLPLLPPQRRRAVPWGGLATLGAFLFMNLVPGVLAAILPKIGLFEEIYGPGISKVLSDEDNPGHALAMVRLSLWSMVLAFPLVLVFLCGYFALVVGAAPYQFGWTFAQWPRRLLLGVLAWLLATPLLYALFVCVTIGYRGLLHGPEQPHALEVLAKGGPERWEWALLVLSAVIVAPVQEELVFRGIMQPWANQSFRNADLMVLWALPLTLLSRSGPFLWQNLSLEVQPPAFAVFMILLYFSLRAVWRSPVPAGIYATSLLFGCAHAVAWPTPLPLFFLGLILAALAYRTQGLLAPIVLHGLFNSIGCVALFIN